MKKIVTLGINLTDEYKKRLEAVGSLEVFDSVDSEEDFLTKAKDADVIYSDGDYLLDSLPKLKNVFVTYPYIELGVFDSENLASNGVYVANAQGGNRDSIVEWVMYMALSLFRNFGRMVRAKSSFPFELNESLSGKKVLIVGRGSIGSQIGVLCESFGMKVIFFERGDDLAKSSDGVDLVVNALNCNTSSQNLLNEEFFMNLKKGCFYITFARPYTYGLDGLIKSIEADIIAGAAIDCDPESFGDTTNEFYQKALSNEKILVTPHVAFSTKQASAKGREIAIENIEAFLLGKPQNILKKK
ncbi:MAG: NAD(P)-dependent oxidoreductase [Candidatus Berkelbacteria bacterium]